MPRHDSTSAAPLIVGAAEIIPLTDAEGSTFDLQRTFPASQSHKWARFRQRVPSVFASPTDWWVRWGCNLVRVRDHVVLVDTGIGQRPEAFGGLEGRLLHELRGVGVEPGDVDTVFYTHLHVDHVGWSVDAHGRPTFPEARYVMHQAEWEFFQRPEVKAASDYVDQCVTPLASAGVLELVSGETSLVPELTALHTPGHTPGHMSLLVASGGQQAMIMGDVVLQPAQVTEPTWNIVAETDHEQAVKTRRTILDRLESDGIVLVTGHLPAPGFGRIVREDDERFWQAAAPGEVIPGQ